MKMFRWFFIAVIALLASCSINIDSVDQPKDSKRTDSVAVNFGLYINRNATTKAGMAGELNTDRLKGDGGGFGVFAYYGNGALYNENSKPDFMYNQKVEFKTFGTTSVWTYEPIKYWPNEFGAEASSEAADRLTFFAYAPYAAVTPSTGIVTGDGTTGIVGMSRNIASGDPQVMYEANLKPGAGVDLCWGVAADDFTSSVDGSNNHVDKGYPFINLIKPKTGDRIAFDFNHALAQLNVQIDTDIDVESHTGEELVNDGTRIYVRSITFSGFALRGSLNLNSNTTKGPAWYDISGTGRVKRDPVTIHDGRTDGLEGMTTAIDPNETPAGLNPAIIQSQPYDPAVLNGVKHETVNLFASDAVEAPIMVVPTSGVPLSVTIVYDVETADPKLLGYVSDGVTHGISVENAITKSLPDMILSAGKRYVLHLHLGLTSVKLDADVKAWVDTNPASADVPANISDFGTVEIARGGNPLTEIALWKNDSPLAAPDVIVKDKDGNPMSGVTISWESDNTSVAAVAENGVVTLGGATGTAKITATATRQGKPGSASASYSVYVNEVTGISVAPVTSNIVVDQSLNLKATLEINGGNGSNGTPTTLPAITWTSGYEKVNVAPTGDASVSGSTVVANATAAAASDAEAGHTAVITAKVGTPYASAEKSATATLTCVDKISIQSVNLGADSTIVWLSQGASTPTVSVMGTDNKPLTSGITLTWTSDTESVATVTDAGVVTLHGTGQAKLTVTATLAASDTTASDTKTADYKVYVNDVTSVSVAPATSDIFIGGTLGLTATLTLNGGNAVNGIIETMPEVSWSSGYDKVTLDPSSMTAVKAGDKIVATTTATAASTATVNETATITASVTTPAASSDVSGTATLTCKSKITIDTVNLGESSTTVWKHDGASVPTVTVTGTNGQVLTKGVTLSWAVKEGTSASVTEAGVITLNSSGTTTLRVTASIADTDTTAASTGIADFAVYVNEVIGITVAPASATVLPGGTVTLTATLTNTGFGDVTSLAAPTITWGSESTSYVTISSTTGQSTVATGVTTGGSSVVTATVDSAYLQSGAQGSASSTVTCSNATSATGTGFSGGWN